MISISVLCGSNIKASAAFWALSGGVGPHNPTLGKNGSSWVIARHSYDVDNNGAPTLLISDLYFDSNKWPTY